MTYEVIVGNIGTVYDGPSQVEAEEKYMLYVSLSKAIRGRASNEPVTMLIDGEPSLEHDPEDDQDRSWE